MNSWLGHAGGIGRRRESGPVITLSGETDLVSVARLSALISGATLELTLDAPGLSFADTASIRTLMLAARTLKERGGRLVLLHPRRSVAWEARGVWLPGGPDRLLGVCGLVKSPAPGNDVPSWGHILADGQGGQVPCPAR